MRAQPFPLLLLLHLLLPPLASPKLFTMTAHQIHAVAQNEQYLRRALGVDDFRKGSFPSVLDESLYPRPTRLHRTTKASTVASRHFVEYPVNTYIAPQDGTLYISAFQSNHVYKVLPDGALELFARGVYCNMHQPCITLSGPWGITGLNNLLFVASFSTDTILIFSTVNSSFIGSMGNAEELNAPEGLCVGPNGVYLYVASFLSGELVRYHLETRTYVDVMVHQLPGPEGIAFLEGSQLIAVACHTDHSVRLIDVKEGVEMTRITNSSGGGHWSHPVGVASSRESLKHKDILYVSAHHDGGKNDVILAFDVQRVRNVTTVVSLKSLWKGMNELKGPSGMSIHGQSLFVAAYQSHRVLAYEIDHTDHQLELKASIRI
jgi:DNA-binding beta-propeller fold protein YncE